MSCLVRRVDAAGDVVEQQHVALGEQPAADQDLLLVAAGERADLLHAAAAACGSGGARRSRDEPRLSARGRRTPAAEMRGRIGERQVVAHRHRQQQPLGLAVLGHERDADPGADRVARLAQPPRLPADRDLAAARPAGAEQGHEQLALPLAGQAADAEDLARGAGRARRRRTPVARAGRCTSSATGGVLRQRRQVGIGAVDRAAGHQRHRLGLRRSASRVATCSPLRKTVIRSAMVSTSRQRCEVKMTQRPSSRSARTCPNSHSTSRSAQRRGRLVEEEDSRLGGERADDLDHLALRDRERRDELERVDPLDAEPARISSARAGQRRAAGSAAAAPRGSLASSRFSATVIRASASAPGRRSPTPERLRVGRDARASTSSPGSGRAPCVRAQDAAEDLDQRALAGAVLADQRVDLAEVGGERRVAQRPHAAERLRDAGRLDRRGVRSSLSSGRVLAADSVTTVCYVAAGRVVVPREVDLERPGARLAGERAPPRRSSRWRSGRSR